MTAQPLLARLERVRQTGPDRWIASCPTRPDKHPSLSIRELSDGRVLIHDFGGDSAPDVLAAVGLDMTALFPEKPRGMFHHHGPTERRPFNAHDVLACLALETAIALQCANQLRAGEALSPEDHARLVTACGLLVSGMEIANGD